MNANVLLNRVFPAILLASSLLAGAAAFAHGSTKPEHGGVVQLVGETLFELVVQPKAVSLYVMEDHEPVDSAVINAKLTILAKGEKSEVMLKPAGGNKFEAKDVTIPVGARVAVTLVNKTTRAQSGVTFSIK